MKRGIRTVADLRARCVVNHNTGCWIWQGGRTKGAPRLWTFDHARGEKRVMTGPMGAWNIAHQAAPRKGWLVFRRCQVTLCMCPVHLGMAKNRQDIGSHIRLSGVQKGTFLEHRRANLVKAWESRDMKSTPREIVLACRDAGPEVSTTSLAKLHGIGVATVSRIRRNESHRNVV